MSGFVASRILADLKIGAKKKRQGKGKNGFKRLGWYHRLHSGDTVAQSRDPCLFHGSFTGKYPLDFCPKSLLPWRSAHMKTQDNFPPGKNSDLSSVENRPPPINRSPGRSQPKTGKGKIKVSPNPGDAQGPQELKLSPDNTTVLRLVPDDNARELVSNGHYVKSNKISMAVKSCVDFSAALALSGAYRMVVPPGALGKVMQFVSNPALTSTYSCNVVGTGGRVVSKVGYARIAPLGLVFMIYSSLAFITGLYFFKTITKMLEQIKGSVEAILNLILDIQDSHFEASWQYLEHVSKSSREITSCDRLRNATLVNVQRLSIENRAYFNLNMRNIARVYSDIQKIKKSEKWESDKVKEIGQKMPLLMSFCQKATLSLMLHTYFAAVELELSGMTDPRVLDVQYSQIKQLSKTAADQLDEVSLLWGAFYDHKEVPNVKEIDRQEILRCKKNCTILSEDARLAERNFKALIERVDEINSKPVEFIWIDGAVYVPKEWTKGAESA